METFDLFSAILADLRKRYGGRDLLAVSVIAESVGLTVGSALKKSSPKVNSFPLPVIREEGSAPRVSIFVLATYLAGLKLSGDQREKRGPVSFTVRSKRGRPPKAEVLEARRAAVTVTQLRRSRAKHQDSVEVWP